MPAEHPVDPTWLDVVATQLARSRTAALEASHELLAHYSDTGDTTTQRAVETLINDAADALGALTDSLADTELTLLGAACRAITSRPGDGGGPSSARSRRRRGLDA